MINIIGLKHVKSTIEGRIKLDDNSKAMGGGWEIRCLFMHLRKLLEDKENV